MKAGKWRGSRAEAGRWSTRPGASVQSWRRAEGLSKAPTQSRSSQPLMQTVHQLPPRPLVPAQPPISLLPPPLSVLSFLHCVRQLLPLCPPVCGSLCLERASPASPMTPASGSRPLLQYPLHTATFSGPSTARLSCSYFPPELLGPDFTCQVYHLSPRQKQQLSEGRTRAVLFSRGRHSGGPQHRGLNEQGRPSDLSSPPARV